MPERLRRVRGTRAYTVEVELRSSAIEDPAALGVAERLDGRMPGACCVGDSSTRVAGEEALYLKDYDVEPAPGAGAADPIVDQPFQGVTARFQPTSSSSSAFACGVELEPQEQLGSLTRREGARIP